MVFGEGDIYGNRKDPDGFDNIDNDFDGRPGNTADSESYSRIYDPHGNQEVSNLPEYANYIEAQRLIQAAEDYHRSGAYSDERTGVHLFPNVGKFIVPQENTWLAHAEMVKNPDYALGFDTERFVYFDHIVAEEFGNRALWDHNHPDYHKFEGLRTNIAVMRNDIIGMYLDDGSFDPGDEKYIPQFTSIAAALGQSLANDSWIKRPFTQHMNVDVANIEGLGAREMYKHLLDLQTEHGSAYSMLSGIGFLNIPNRTWDLKPLEDTPYSTDNLAASAPEPKISLTSDELANYMKRNKVPAANQVAAYSELALENAKSLNALEHLDEPVREESIEEARTILRWLKNLEFGEKDMAEWMDQGTPAEKLAKAESIARLTEIYARQLAQASHKDPNITHSLPAEDANGAAGALAVGLAEHGLRGLPEDHPATQHLAQMARFVPDNWPVFESASVAMLLDTIDEGLEYTSNASLDRTVASQRLLDISNHMDKKARTLQSIDTLRPPAREESIELAREILRRLRDMRFEDQTLEEMMDMARPEEKSAFARNLSGLVDEYSGLLEEAAQTNPALMDSQEIKDANDAVGTFSYGIKLMAAKEMPGSMAAAQQISADIANMPEHWKKLDGRTVGRLLATMEKGVARAVEEIEMKMQQAQEQDEELAQQAVESSAHHDHHRKRRKKKRFAFSSGGLTKAAKRRNANDLNGDGVADDLQGIDLRKKNSGGGTAAMAALAATSSEEARKIANRKSAQDADGDGIPDEFQGIGRKKSDGGGNATMAALAAASSEEAVKVANRHGANDVNGDGIPDHLQGLGAKKSDSGGTATMAALAAMSSKEAVKNANRKTAQDADGDGVPDHLQGKQDSKHATATMAKLAANSSKEAQKAAQRRTAADVNGDGVPDHLQGLNIGGTDQAAIKRLGDSLREISKEADRLRAGLTEVSKGDTVSPDDRGFSLREKEQFKPNNNQQRK